MAYYGGCGEVPCAVVKMGDGSRWGAPCHMALLLVRQDRRDGSLGGCGWGQGLVAGWGSGRVCEGCGHAWVWRHLPQAIGCQWCLRSQWRKNTLEERERKRKREEEDININTRKEKKEDMETEPNCVGIHT